MVLSPAPRALFFDVFGTCVDWRQTVVNMLNNQSRASLDSNTASIPPSTRLRASGMTIEDWGLFAQQWRNSYKQFTRKLAHDASWPWVSVDEHHLSSLKTLMSQWEIVGLWNEDEVQDLSLIWHRLQPWEDSGEGIAMLNKMFDTCTLSNGNISLLSDLRDFSGIPFTRILSAEMFETYKPSPRVYLGAADQLNLVPEQCAMVAAHLNDLQAAKKNGLRTIYIERPGEEEWSDGEVAQAKQEGWVDLWISSVDGTKGFITLAEELGVGIHDSDHAKVVSEPGSIVVP